MSQTTSWHTSDFERLSWHDCHVYALRITEGEHGTGELELDIDLIVEWLCHKDQTCRFRVAPATLTFHQIFGLRVELDYASVRAGMTPFSLDGIEREPISYSTGRTSFRWRLVVNWPSGSISFEGPGFTQILRAAPILIDTQALNPVQRRQLSSG
jgi:hypothetical protein